MGVLCSWKELRMVTLIVGAHNFNLVKRLVLVQILKPRLFNNDVWSFKWTEFYNLYQNKQLYKSKVISSHYEFRKVHVRLPGKENSHFHGARPVH